MANVISLKNYKRFERHYSNVNMRGLKASVELMKLSDSGRSASSAEIVQDKTLTQERQ